MSRKLSGLLLLALLLGACSDGRETRSVEAPPLGPGPLQTEDLQGFGRDLDAAVEIAPGIFQARGTANAQLVVTNAGNVVIDTGLVNQGWVQDYLRDVNDRRVTHLILSHAHADHFSAAKSFIDAGTEVIAHREFPHNQNYLKELSPLFMPRNAIFFPNDVPKLPGILQRAIKLLIPTVDPTKLVYDDYAFEVGGTRFEVLAMPGAEGSDGLCVWLPDRKILFTGDFFGHIFPMWPNLGTIRGERTRFALPYVDSLNRVLELDPEMLVPSHFEPVVGREKIRAGVKRTRDAVLYVHDRVIDGMNDGKDVYTLMREIRLPPDLRLPELHGKVSWGVRSIVEGYSGWFQLRSSAGLYAVPPWSVHAEVVDMAGGPVAISERAEIRLHAGEPVQALHLVDMALEADPENPSALHVRLAALYELLERGNDVNHYETYWLRHRIDQTRAQLTAAGETVDPPDRG